MITKHSLQSMLDEADKKQDEVFNLRKKHRWDRPEYKILDHVWWTLHGETTILQTLIDDWILNDNKTQSTGYIRQATD